MYGMLFWLKCFSCYQTMSKSGYPHVSVNMSTITLPSGSTPIASTSSGSSSPQSARSSHNCSQNRSADSSLGSDHIRQITSFRDNV